MRRAAAVALTAIVIAAFAAGVGVGRAAGLSQSAPQDDASVHVRGLEGALSAAGMPESELDVRLRTRPRAAIAPATARLFIAKLDGWNASPRQSRAISGARTSSRSGGGGHGRTRAA